MARLLLLFLFSVGISVQAKTIEENIYAIKCGTFDVAKESLDDPSSDISKTDTNGLTPLLSAASEGRGDILLYLFLSKGADLKATDSQKRNLFHLATVKGNFGVIQTVGNTLRKSNPRLLEKLLKSQDDLGMMPLHLAAQYGQKEVLTYILGLGIVNPNMLDGNGKSPLYWALKNKQNEAAQTLIASKGFDINNQSPWGMSALHEAARGGNIDVVKKLVEKGADLNIKDVDGRTPLYWASERGHPEVVLFLIEKGADPTITDDDKRTILHRAARYGHTEVVKGVLEKTKLDINGEDSLENTALCWAAKNGHIETVQELLKNKADLNALKKNGGEIFQEIVKKGDKVMVQLLVSKGFDVNESDTTGKTALHHAAAEGDGKMTALLVRMGADTKAKDKEGQTPLAVAASGSTGAALQVLGSVEAQDLPVLQATLQKASSSSNTQGMETILKKYRDDRDQLKSLLETKDVDLYQKDAKGKSLFNYAADKGDIKLLTLLMLLGDKDKIINLLKDNKAKFDTVDRKDRMTMLHYAALMGEPSLAEAIGGAGATIDLPQTDGSTALHNAVSSKSAPTVEALLKMGASFRVQNKRGATPFTKAIESKFGDGVEAFLKHGADPTTYVGEVRPQEEAIKYGNAEMVELFMDHVKGDMKALDDFHKTSVLQDMQDDQGMTLIHWVAKKGHSGLLDVVLMLAVRPNMSGVDKSGRTALHYAAAGGFNEIITKLYKQKDAGLDLNTQSNDRTTAMHEAAINKHDDTVKMLIQLGADQTLKDSKGKIAVDYLPDGGKKILDELNPPKPKEEKPKGNKQ
ncbi:MAG: hypothetical protein FJX18_03005 [Alphaproteobacteria bacterium]|nr:hypothetical protein [Alphaproteobacteria bacterium]